jgi:hypothetical protein
VYKSVVVATDAERGRGTPEHLDLARCIGLDPDGRVGGAGVPQERAQDELSHGVSDRAAGW